MSTEVKYWTGDAPEQCDVCHVKLFSTFVDGRTSGGQWAFMCDRDHRLHGVGLGEGKGQKYQKLADGRWLKVGG